MNSDGHSSVAYGILFDKTANTRACRPPKQTPKLIFLTVVEALNGTLRTAKRQKKVGWAVYTVYHRSNSCARLRLTLRFFSCPRTRTFRSSCLNKVESRVIIRAAYLCFCYWANSATLLQRFHHDPRTTFATLPFLPTLFKEILRTLKCPDRYSSFKPLRTSRRPPDNLKISFLVWYSQTME